MMRTLFMAALLALLSIQTATGAEIQKVRVFAGDEHARIIVLNSDTITGLETRSSPATSTAPARATLLLPGAAMGKTVQPRIPIGKAGIKQIQIVQDQQCIDR